jgi:formamidopyrimidine-DNA glycosylase
MWCETSGLGPVLGLHLGMSGKVVVADGGAARSTAATTGSAGGPGATSGFTRFALTFGDGGRMVLDDPRRLSRVRLDPPVERLGPDAREVTPAQFRAALARGTAPVKARLLDQEAIAGVGNLLADQALWLAKINPARPVDELTPAEVNRLHKAVRKAVDSAVDDGGVHTLSVVPARVTGGRAPGAGPRWPAAPWAPAPPGGAAASSASRCAGGGAAASAVPPS